MAASLLRTLAPNLQQHFWDLVKKWNLEPGDVLPEIKTANIAPKTIVGGDPAVSHVKTKPFNFPDVAKMKEMVGVPDAMFDQRQRSDRSVVYPPQVSQRACQLLRTAPNQCSLKDNLSEADHAVIRQAWQAYVMGDSRKISPALVDLVNAVHFPMTVGVSAAQNITVDSGNTLTIGTPGGPAQTVLFGTLQVQPNGFVDFAAPTTFNGSYSQVAAGSEPTFKIYSAAPQPPATPPAQGQIGPAGANAVTGTAVNQGSDKSPKWVCSGASAAGDGLSGYTGTPGGNGSNGVPPAPVVSTIALGTGAYTFLAGGGDGANGGQGGQGGQGGNAGNGCGSNTACGAQNPGRGGQGGQGGGGGNPGNAVPGSASNFTFTNIQNPFTTSVQTVGGVGGQPGLGGTGGGPGSGGADLGNIMGSSYIPANYNMGSGQNGATGNYGNPGTNAPGGQVFLNIGPPVS